MTYGYLEINVRCSLCQNLLSFELRGKDLFVDTMCEGCMEIDEQNITDGKIPMPSVIHTGA